MKKLLLLTAMLFIKILLNAQSYCPSSNYFLMNEASNYYISNVTLGSINNNTSKSSSGYGNYTNLSTGITVSRQYTISVTHTKNEPNYDPAVRAYIDYNKDGDFLDNGEILFDVTRGGPYRQGSYTVSGTFIVPYGVSLGSTRIRVITSRSDITSPCGGYYYGEVEDYSVNICSRPNIPSSISLCNGASYSLTSSGADWNSFWANHPADHNPSGVISVSTGASTTVTGRVGSTSTKYWLWASSNGCDNTPYEISVTVFNCREGEIEEVKQISSSVVENYLEINNPNKEDLSINLVSLDGKVIFQEATGNENISYAIHNLENGIYLLSMTTSIGEHINKKVVINK